VIKIPSEVCSFTHIFYEVRAEKDSRVHVYTCCKLKTELKLNIIFEYNSSQAGHLNIIIKSGNPSEHSGHKKRLVSVPLSDESKKRKQREKERVCSRNMRVENHASVEIKNNG